jgi:hypothetical protein
MKKEDIQALADEQLELVSVWADAEKKARTERTKQQTIARIKEMASAVGIMVSIQSPRGRPGKTRGAATVNSGAMKGAKTVKADARL